MARKTPDNVLEVMNYQQAMMRYVDEILAAKRKRLENQTDRVKEEYWTEIADKVEEEYWIGLADGINAMLEKILYAHNCYAGFEYQAATGYALESGEMHYPTIRPDNPEYQGWRRIYNTLS
jgi:hypothetical protein